MGSKQRNQIVMTDEEITDFVARGRTGTMATIGASGQPHLVAMWYAVLDGEIWIETKVKSQKVVNLRRNSRVSFLIEDGMTYDSLRGVSFEGVAEIYNGPYTDDLKPAVDMMMNKRVAVRIVTDRVRSWDHRKLGLPAMPLAGTTAPQ